MEYDARNDEYPDELPEVPTDDGLAPRQRSPRTDPSMRDGDSGHGNPLEYPPPEEPTSDTDTGDSESEPVRADIEGGATEGTTADMRSDVDTDADDFTLRPDLESIPEPPELDEQGRVIDVAEKASEPELPIADYQTLTVKQIGERAADLPIDEIRQLRDYEVSHRNRKTLVAKLDKLASGTGQRRHTGSMSESG